MFCSVVRQGEARGDDDVGSAQTRTQYPVYLLHDRRHAAAQEPPVT